MTAADPLASIGPPVRNCERPMETRASLDIVTGPLDEWGSAQPVCGIMKSTGGLSDDRSLSTCLYF
jgi:hypothetical protein